MHEADLVANTVKTWLGNPHIEKPVKVGFKKNRKGQQIGVRSKEIHR